MTDSPIAASPYEILGVARGATQEELRKAFRRRMRETHPDTGGDAAEFHAVQWAWERIGTPEERAAYDRGGSGSTGARPAWAPAPPRRPEDTRPTARQYGHPGGWWRERYLEHMREWVGRGVTLDDPYEPELVRSAPRDIRHLLAAAVAEEQTARQLATLGIGFTIWHDVRTDALGGGPEQKLDHIVLGPTGLWALLSEDWGSPVGVKRGELIGEGLAGARPVHDLGLRAKSMGRSARVRFTGLAVVVPDDALAESVVALGTVRGATALVVQRSRIAGLLRQGIQGIGTGGTELFEVRTRLQSAVRFV